jgi:hypothetical protein
MKIVMTLLVRNEADILEAQISFHLNAGVDFVMVTDNGSDDGTSDILAAYAREGVLHFVVHPDRHVSQIDCVTQMARLAATRFDADWVLNSDADEFWWPRGGSLKEVLGAVPSRFGSVRGMWRHFVPRPPVTGSFAERMTVRLCAPVTHAQHVFNPHYKTAHRAHPAVAVGGGNHDATGDGLLPLTGWYPIDVLHFPLRSFEQCERKYVQHYEWRKGLQVDPFMAAAYEAARQGRMREFYESHVVDDEALARGLRDCTLAIDTRLREALRSSAAGRRPLAFTEVGVDRDYVSEVATLEEHNPIMRAQRRVEALEKRLTALETTFPSRLRSRLLGSRPRMTSGLGR